MTKTKIRPIYWFSQFLVRMFFRIFYGLRIYGMKNVPKTGRFVLAANHVSDLDPPLVGACIPREMFFAAKEQLFGNNLMGKFIRYHNGIPVRRHGSDTEAIKKLVKCLREDNPVLIFPEGTRTLDSNGLDAKAGVGMIAMLGRADLIPARVDGTQTPKKSLFKPGGITLRIGEPIKLEDIINKEHSKKENYRAVADSVMNSIRGMARSDSK